MTGPAAFGGGQRQGVGDRLDPVLARARGHIWTASLAPEAYEALRPHLHVLQAQPQGARLQVRMAHPSRPFAEAQPAQATLEEALMAEHYADAREAA